METWQLQNTSIYAALPGIYQRYSINLRQILLNADMARPFQRCTVPPSVAEKMELHLANVLFYYVSVCVQLSQLFLHVLCWHLLHFLITD